MSRITGRLASIGFSSPSERTKDGATRDVIVAGALAGAMLVLVVLAHLAMARFEGPGGPGFPLVLRAVGATVALAAGVMKLASFLGKRQSALLVVGVAFLGVGLVEACRTAALLLADAVGDLTPLAVAARAGWAASITLPLLLLIGLVLVPPGNLRRKPWPRVAYFGVAAAIVVLGALGPWFDLLPGGIVGGSVVARPAVVWTIATYLIAFALLWRRRDVSGTLDGRWLVFALYIGFLDQIFVAPYWIGIGTTAGAVDGLLKLATYLVAAIGVLVHTTTIARSQEAAVARFRREALERRRIEDELARQAARLATANEELEQYAYLASHDLQEPLRMITNYLQLVERRYADAIDDDGREFIGYAVDGARRMKRLTNDLLAYSRLDDELPSDARTDAGEAIDEALRNLEIRLEESEATVTRDPLPTVAVDEVRLVLLFQNLIGNAVKFRREGVPPRVHVTAHRDGDDGWTFSVRDNGIGIDPKYHDRVFGVFQRLHGREAFAGSGIGLAMVRKIVEAHGGRIAIESIPDEGTTFRFTLPATPREGRRGSQAEDPELESRVSGLIDRARELI